MSQTSPPLDAEGLGVAFERTTREHPSPRMALQGPASPWRAFEATLTEEERRDELVEWSRPRVAEFIAATAEMTRGFFSNGEDASGKALLSLAIELSERSVERMDFAVSLAATRFGSSRDDFSGSIKIEATGMSAQPSVGDSPDTLYQELAASLAPAPTERVGRSWSDAEGALALWDQMRLAMGDERGTKSAQGAALLLVHLDQVAARNAGTADCRLVGMSQRDHQGSEVQLGLDAVIHVERAETRLEMAPGTRSRM